MNFFKPSDFEYCGMGDPNKITHEEAARRANRKLEMEAIVVYGHKGEHRWAYSPDDFSDGPYNFCDRKALLLEIEMLPNRKRTDG